MTDQNALTEDELASAVMDSMGTDDDDWRPEVHYNHYGDRGVVDLVLIQEEGSYKTLRVFELKCQPALESATGANEILRQFNRHRSYFFKGSDYKANDYNEVSFELTFAAEQPCYEHVRKNWQQYKYIANEKDGRIRTQLLFRTDQAGMPFVPRDGGVLPSCRIEEVEGFDPVVVQ